LGGYSVGDYGRMIADSVRATAYADALRRACRANATSVCVADLGSGTGFLSLLACQYGARRIFAIEPDDVIAVAREAAAANGFSDRIEFIQADARTVDLPERVDIVISDLRGVLPFEQTHLDVVADARRRMLRPGGIIIPQRDTLWAALVEAPGLYDRHVAPRPSDSFGLNLDAARGLAANTFSKAHVATEQLLAGPVCWTTIDYETVSSPHAAADVGWQLSRSGTAHGMAVWFDTVLFDGVGFSNAPPAPKTIYGQAFFPFERPIEVAAGATLHIALRADLVGDDYVWSWTTRLDNGALAGTIEFRQSTMFGIPLSRDVLRKAAATHVAELNDDGRLDHFVMSLLIGGVAVGEAAKRLRAAFPESFLTEAAALTRVGSLSRRYSR
jgi:protein arginine N-methyltransferase 1